MYGNGKKMYAKAGLLLLCILCFITTAVWESTIERLRSEVNTGLISFINYHGEETSFMHNYEKCPSPSVK